jgi:RNA polymerase sigma factor (sigma-70 family)
MNKHEIENAIFSNEIKIKRFFLKNVYDKEDVDDLVQETICGIISSFNSFSGRSSPATWIYAICRNVLLYELRNAIRKELT